MVILLLILLSHISFIWSFHLRTTSFRALNWFGAFYRRWTMKSNNQTVAPAALGFHLLGVCSVWVVSPSTVSMTISGTKFGGTYHIICIYIYIYIQIIYIYIAYVRILKFPLTADAPEFPWAPNVIPVASGLLAARAGQPGIGIFLAREVEPAWGMGCNPVPPRTPGMIHLWVPWKIGVIL